MMQPLTGKKVQQLKAVTHCYLAILEAVHESQGTILGGVPEGHAYMAFQGLVDLAGFQSMIGVLRDKKAIEISGHVMMPGPNLRTVMDGLTKSLDILEGRRVS